MWDLFNSSCYKGIKTGTILSFSEAQDLCRQEDSLSHLPTVHSMAELNFLVELGKKEGWFGPKKGVYLGGTIVEGKVIWTDGTPTDFTFWREGFIPSHSRGCVAVFLSLTFEQTSCHLDRGKRLLDTFNMVETKDRISKTRAEDFLICQVSHIPAGKLVSAKYPTSL